MSWHWIIDDDRLSSTEKMVMLSIVRNQFNGGRTGVSQFRIAKGAGISVRATQKAISSAEAKGYPIVETRDCKGNATHYLVRQTQAIIGSNANSIGPDRSDARSKTPRTSPSAYERSSHPPHPPTNLVRTLSVTTSVNSKETPALPRDSLVSDCYSLAKEEEDRRKFAARNKRLAVERATESEVYIGKAPRPEDCGVRINPAALERIRERERKRA